jgi:hypothetical protein
VSCFNEGPEVKQLSGVSEIVINGCVAVILVVNRKVMEVLTASFFLLEGGFDKKIKCFSCLHRASSTYKYFIVQLMHNTTKCS